MRANGEGEQLRVVVRINGILPDDINQFRRQQNQVSVKIHHFLLKGYMDIWFWVICCTLYLVFKERAHRAREQLNGFFLQRRQEEPPVPENLELRRKMKNRVRKFTFDISISVQW